MVHRAVKGMKRASSSTATSSTSSAKAGALAVAESPSAIAGGEAPSSPMATPLPSSHSDISSDSDTSSESTRHQRKKHRSKRSKKTKKSKKQAKKDKKDNNEPQSKKQLKQEADETLLERKARLTLEKARDQALLKVQASTKKCRADAREARPGTRRDLQYHWQELLHLGAGHDQGAISGGLHGVAGDFCCGMPHRAIGWQVRR